MFMKEKILLKSRDLIKDTNNNIDEIKLEEIIYGIEALYLSITKLSIILLISIIFHIFKEVILFILFFNIIRFTGFGVHAKKSWECLLYSSLIFIGIPLISKYIIIPNYIKLLLYFPINILFLLYAPADTEKRPIISIKRRKIYKFITILISVIYIYLSIVIKNNFISNILLFSLITEIILINPLTYKLLRVSYNNYKKYKNVG